MSVLDARALLDHGQRMAGRSNGCTGRRMGSCRGHLRSCLLATLILSSCAARLTAGSRPDSARGSALALDGVDSYMFASVAAPDPFTTEATLAAWVYLDELPDKAGHVFHVCGKSGFGRDWTSKSRRTAACTSTSGAR